MLELSDIKAENGGIMVETATAERQNQQLTSSIMLQSQSSLLLAGIVGQEAPSMAEGEPDSDLAYQNIE